MEILIGADPEVFVRDAANRNISGHDMIPGTKKRPHPVRRGAVQVDGTALEFNIVPAKTADEFVETVHVVLDQLKAMIPPQYSIDLSAVAKYEETYFRSLPSVVKAMGCDPDFDAYTGVEIDHRGIDKPMRTAAGHIHIGWTKDEDPYKAKHYQSCRTLTKELDCWLGLPSVIFDPESHERRSMYGKAGSFRPKPYGCEYRVLSNKWLQSDEMMAWVFNQTKRAFDYLMSGQPPLQNAFNSNTVQSIINDSQAVAARKMLEQCGVSSLLAPNGEPYFYTAKFTKVQPKGFSNITEEDMRGLLVRNVAGLEREELRQFNAAAAEARVRAVWPKLDNDGNVIFGVGAGEEAIRRENQDIIHENHGAEILRRAIREIDEDLR